MKNYFPYKSDKPEKKYYIITKDNKRVYFGAEGYYDCTLYYKKYGKELANDKKKLILIGMKKIRIGPRAALIALDFGVGGYCGTNQVLNHHIKILKKDF